MKRSVTVSVQGLLVSGLVLLALVTAYLLGGAGGTPVRPAAAAGQDAPVAARPAEEPALRMVGTGEVSVVPDQLTFALSVTDKELDLETALDDSSATLQRVLSRLKDFGVREADVQTTGLEMRPEYDYPSYGPPVLTGYRVTQKARVEVRDLAQGGKAVTAAIATGGNGVRVADLRLSVSDPVAALDRARDAAVADATAKAEQYAAAADQELGDVLTLREVTDRTGSRMPLARGYAVRDARELDAVPISAGKQDLDVKVEVTWAFAGPAAE